jgi:hypothetical protein
MEPGNQIADKIAECRRLRKQLDDALTNCAVTPPAGAGMGKWKLPGDDTVNAKDLRLWIRAMHEWGQRVRQDILRLEAAACLSVGDPGDPPRPPE